MVIFMFADIMANVAKCLIRGSRSSSRVVQLLIEGHAVAVRFTCSVNIFVIELSGSSSQHEDVWMLVYHKKIEEIIHN